MSLAFLFPGQGSQQPDMLDTLPSSPAVSAVLDESHLSVNGISTAGRCGTTDVQIALLIAGVACARALTEDYGLTPQFVAGHSVGTFAAAVIAGVITLAEALAAVALRGRLMEEACADGDWGMAAVSGLPIRSAGQIAQQVATADDPVWVANINSATQTVLSGTASGLQKAGRRRRGSPERSTTSDSTCRWRRTARNRQAPRDSWRHTWPDCRGGSPPPATSPTRGDGPRRQPRPSSTTWPKAVAHPVQWYDATRLMGELGATCAIETQPGHVLTRLAASAEPAFAVISLQDSGVEGAARRADRILEG